MIPLGILASSALAPATPVGTYYDEVMADSPVAYYRLADSASPAVDATARTTQSTIGGVTFDAAGLGDGATSATFDGTTGILTGATSNLNGVVALEALCSLPTLGASRALVGVGGGVAATELAMIRISTTGAAQFYMFGAATVSVTSSATITAGSVNHIVGVIADGLMRVYVNGVASGTSTAPPTTTQASTNLAIGYRAAASGGAPNHNPFAGRLAGCAVYATPPSPARILVHARAAGVA